MAALMSLSICQQHMPKKTLMNLLETSIILEEEIQQGSLFKNVLLDFNMVNSVPLLQVVVEPQQLCSTL